MIDFAFVHSQEHHYIPPATPDRFDASVNQYDAYGRPKASLGDGWCLNGKLAKHQKTTFRTQRKWPKPTDHGTFVFFYHQSCVIICRKKDAASESWWRLQLRIGTHFGDNDSMTFLYKIYLDLNPQWSHIGMFYVLNIEISPLSIVDRWCSMDMFMVTCLKTATRRCHLGVKSQQVSSVWFIGRRVAGVKHWESMILAKFCCIVQKCAQKSAQQPATLAKKC